MLERIEEVLVKENPDWLLVYGDTNSTLAGALAAVKLHVPVAHVEAGLRSFNRRMPEEINRVLTDHASSALFAPTEAAVAHLASEGIPDEKVRWSGDVMYDAALVYGEAAERKSKILATLDLKAREYVLATVHRAESTDDPGRLEAILGGLADVAADCPVILPLHPRTRNLLAKNGQLETLQRKLKITEPLGYLDMLMLERNARVIATDSGGVQKEAFFFRVPCVTLRTETEWTELVELGWNTLAQLTSADAVAKSIRKGFTSRGREGGQMYGDGHAARKIADALLNWK
jgi:UDP-GlcNAc3NAcA epimerase